MDDELNGKKVTVEDGDTTALDKFMDVVMKKAGLTMKEYDRVRDMVLEVGRVSASVRASLKVGVDVAEANLGRKLEETEFGLLMESYVSTVTITLITMLNKGMVCEENTCALKKSMEYMKGQLDILKGGTGDGGGNAN